MAAEVTGYTADDMHEFALCRFFGHMDQTVAGIVRRVVAARAERQRESD